MKEDSRKARTQSLGVQAEGPGLFSGAGDHRVVDAVGAQAALGLCVGWTGGGKQLGGCDRVQVREVEAKAGAEAVGSGRWRSRQQLRDLSPGPAGAPDRLPCL